MIWAFAGFSVGITALFCVFFAQFGADQPFFEANRLLIAGLVLGLGVTLWFVGRHKKAKADKAAAEQGEQSEQEETKSGFPIDLFSMQHWAILFTILSVCIVFIRPWKIVRTQMNSEVTALQREEKKSVARKPVLAVVTVTNQLAKATPAKPPKIKLQGIVFREKNPSALINGQTYYVGDRVEGVEILAVSRQFVTMKFADETRTLVLR